MRLRFLPARWVVLAENSRLRWGGDLRRHYIFRDLARTVRAVEVDGWNGPAVERGVASAEHRFRRPPRIASVEFLNDIARTAANAADLAVLDVHDHPVLQHEAFGVPLPDEQRRTRNERYERNVETFELLVAPSETFMALAELDPRRTIVAPNGTDTSVIQVQPRSTIPTIAMASGAAPARGIEMLVDAARLVRANDPSVRLDLWLVSNNDSSKAYLDGLRRSLAADRWITISEAAYAELGRQLGRANVICVPSPPNAYMDAAVPVKLLDALAAGRPAVVTPRTEARRLIEKTGGGIVAQGDSPDAMAAAIESVLNDDDLAERLGSAARKAAETDYDWRVIGRRLTRNILARQ